MIKTKKQMFIVIGVFTLILLLGTTTYAFFNYTRTGSANTIRVGRINFITRQTDTINLTNLFPIDPTETGIMDDATKVGTLEIEIEGDTDYSGGIEYLVSSVDSSITTSTGKVVPLSLAVTVSGLGTSNANYFIARENTNVSIYKKIVGDALVGDQMLLVGYITKNNPSGTAAGVNGSITIKAYLDENKILISDTYDGTESDNMGTLNNMAEGKTILTTTEWNALQSSGLSFKVKVEANQGIWVNGSLEEIMRKSAVMDNIQSTYVSASTGIDFGSISSDTNGKGVYMRAGTQNDDYPIMYYRGEIENNNVLFANKCWKAVRTTNTGGVKLIYNGESQELYEELPLVESKYTKNTTNTDSRWTFNSSDNTWNILIEDNTKPAIEFTVPEGDNYKLIMTGTSGSSCGGTYTFYKNGTSLKSGSNGGGGAMDLTNSFEILTATDVIKMSYTGSSSSTCAITFKLKMVRRGEKLADYVCNNSGIDTHIPVGNTKFANRSTSPAYNGYMWGEVYEWTNAATTSGAYYGTGFTWDGTNYTLTNAKVGYDGTHHYTCNLTTAEGACSSIRYYYYVSGTSYNYYITLTGGDSIEKAIEKMQTNTNDSNAKDKIDTWFEENLTNIVDYTKKDYRSYLEDTIWCNDRSFGDNNNNGWIANGGDLSTYLYYGARERSNYAANTSTVKNQPSLVCANKNDRFTVNNTNGNGDLTYPTALLTEDEMVLAGGLAGTPNTTFYLNNYNGFWSLSPSGFVYNSNSVFEPDNFYIFNGTIGNYTVAGYVGLRPSVSLKLGTPVVSGTGTALDPYVIE